MTSFLPMMVLSRPYFAGLIEMGQISQAGMAYGTVLNALSLVTSNVDGLTAFAAESARLSALLAALRASNVASPAAGAPQRAGAAGGAPGGGGGAGLPAPAAAGAFLSADGGALGAGGMEQEMQQLGAEGISRGTFGAESEEVLRVERLAVRFQHNPLTSSRARQENR